MHTKGGRTVNGHALAEPLGKIARNASGGSANESVQSRRAELQHFRRRWYE
jgi:hypothetical protein